MPILSIAWRNQAEARRDEFRHGVVALQKAAEANEQRLRAETSLKFLVDAFRKPDPALDGRSLKVIDLLDRAVKDLDVSLAGQPLTQATLYNAIGETFSGLGLSRESLSAFERALEIRRHQLGNDHPETLESCQNLAMAYQDAGRLDRAIPILKDTLTRRRAVLGDDHVDAIESMNDLAVAYWEAGRPAEAIPLFEAVLPRVKVRLGPDHLDTLTIMDNLAVGYTAENRPEEAVSLHESALAGFRSKLGDDHPTTLVAINNLAKTYQAVGRLDEAIQLRQTTTTRLRAQLGEDHPTTLTTMHGLARAYQDAGRLDRAIPLSRIVLSKRRAKMGDDHPDTLRLDPHSGGSAQRGTTDRIGDSPAPRVLRPGSRSSHACRSLSARRSPEWPVGWPTTIVSAARMTVPKRPRHPKNFPRRLDPKSQHHQPHLGRRLHPPFAINRESKWSQGNRDGFQTMVRAPLRSQCAESRGNVAERRGISKSSSPDVISSSGSQTSTDGTMPERPGLCGPCARREERRWNSHGKNRVVSHGPPTKLLPAATPTTCHASRTATWWSGGRDAGSEPKNLATNHDWA